MVRKNGGKVIMREIQGAKIGQREKDGYINATAMCQAGGKKLNDYLRLQGTKEYLEALSADTGIPVSDNSKGSSLVVFAGSSFGNQDTWVHPEVAVDLGKWISPQFRIAVNRWIVQWMSGQTPSTVDPIAFLVAGITREPKAWEVHFSPDWIREAERLTGWSWRWSCMAGFINRSVYEILPLEFRQRLDEVNPVLPHGKRARKQHQHVDLTVDELVLKQIIAETLGMMRGSVSLQDYYRSHQNAYSNGIQLTLTVGGVIDA